MKSWIKYLLAAAVLYAILLSGMFAAMLQPPATFGHIMRRLPTLSYFLFPFEPMWLVARRGKLKVGDAAPDFTLKTADNKNNVQLSSFRGQKPVVLIFGSHT